MDEDQASDVTCWGAHSQAVNASHALFRKAEHVVLTKQGLCFAVEDGSLLEAVEGRECRKIASDVEDIFSHGKQILIRDKEGQIYECPIGVEHQNEKEKIPVPFPMPEKKIAVQIACGKSHMIVLMKYGEIYAAGDNTYGQLGLGKMTNAPTKLRMINSVRGLPISQIAAGAWSSFCVTISGRVFVWGQNEFGQLGLKASKRKKVLTPRLLQFSTEIAVAFISAGERHTAFLTRDGELYTCGENSYGQLGHMDTSKKQVTPWRVQELRDSIVTQVACGLNHTIAYVPGCRQVFGFGDNREGQLGISRNQNFISNPAMLSGPWCENHSSVIKKVFAGGDSTLVLHLVSLEEALQADYRIISDHRQIAKIDEKLCEKIAMLIGDPEIPEQELEKLGSVFSSQSCLSASFCADEKRPMAKDFLGIDFSKAHQVTEKLCSHDSLAICDCIAMSLQKGIVQNLSNHCKDIEAFKVYAILPAVVTCIFERGVGDDVFLFFVEKALASHREDLKKLFELVSQEYFISVISLCKNIVKNVLFVPVSTISDQNKLEHIVDMLKILFNINAEHNIVKDKEFCISGLQDKHLSEHYLQWKGTKAAKWNFCEFPFLLDAKAKTTLLQIDSKRRLCMVYNRPDALTFEVDREDLIGSVRAFEGKKDFQRPFQIKFIGEDGMDDGALKKEFFMLIFEELLDCKNSYGLFDENETSHLLWFPKNNDEANLHLYDFIGKLCGMALYSGIIVNFNLPLALYKELLGKKPNLDDFIEIDPSFGNSLRQILDFTEEDDLTVEDTFCLSFTAPDVTPLVDGGQDIPVTAGNREEYVSHYLEYFFHKSVQAKLDAFRNGFFQACARDMISLFRPDELMEMVTGIEDYDWEALKNSTVYERVGLFQNVGFHEQHPVITWFWEVLLSMSKEDKNKFLIFLTGSDKIPITGLHMKIRERVETDDFLPVANVCYNTLQLHPYSSKEILEERLRLAIECKGYYIV